MDSEKHSGFLLPDFKPDMNTANQRRSLCEIESFRKAKKQRWLTKRPEQHVSIKKNYGELKILTKKCNVWYKDDITCKAIQQTFENKFTQHKCSIWLVSCSPMQKVEEQLFTTNSSLIFWSLNETARESKSHHSRHTADMELRMQFFFNFE